MEAQDLSNLMFTLYEWLWIQNAADIRATSYHMSPQFLFFHSCKVNQTQRFLNKRLTVSNMTCCTASLPSADFVCIWLLFYENNILFFMCDRRFSPIYFYLSCDNSNTYDGIIDACFLPGSWHLLLRTSIAPLGNNELHRCSDCGYSRSHCDPTTNSSSTFYHVLPYRSGIVLLPFLFVHPPHWLKGHSTAAPHSRRVACRRTYLLTRTTLPIGHDMGREKLELIHPSNNQQTSGHVEK